jgi:hypothetical protein
MALCISPFRSLSKGINRCTASASLLAVNSPEQPLNTTLRKERVKDYRQSSLATCGCLRLCLYRLNGDEPARLSPVGELDFPSDLCVKGVVFAPANVETRLEPGSALTHDNGAAGDHLASEDLHTQPLCV